jgi:hypothetical protein
MMLYEPIPTIVERRRTMKVISIAAMGILLALLVMPLSAVGADGKGDNFFKGIFDSFKREKLSDSKIINGLKEALEIGSSNAVTNVSKLNGYYENPAIKIPLPKTVQKVEGVMRSLGYGSELDEFSRSMNRAAEQAAPKAKALFWDAVKAMTFEDARTILKGNDDAATRYFEGKTRNPLNQLFMPIVHTAMEAVGVTRAYQSVYAKVSAIPFTDSLKLDLDGYVTEKALDGLFYMVAEEERKIRKDPAARVTKLLKDVFGDKQK